MTPSCLYDAVLLMGPLYHLIEEADRLLALRQAHDRLKEGGLIFTAHISRFGVLGDFIKQIPQWVEDNVNVRSLIERGRERDDKPRVGFRAYFTTLAEIAPPALGGGFREGCARGSGAGDFG